MIAAQARENPGPLPGIQQTSVLLTMRLLDSKKEIASPSPGPKGQFVTASPPDDQQRLHSFDEEVGEKHPLILWTGLGPGDVVALRYIDSQHYLGTVETKTSDGLMIWVRDDLNERKLLHFYDCYSIRVIG